MKTTTDTKGDTMKTKTSKTGPKYNAHLVLHRTHRTDCAFCAEDRDEDTNPAPASDREEEPCRVRISRVIRVCR